MFLVLWNLDGPGMAYQDKKVADPCPYFWARVDGSPSYWPNQFCCLNLAEMTCQNASKRFEVTPAVFLLTLWLIDECPNFFLDNCAQSPQKLFMCPKFRTNPVLKYTICHIPTNLSNFLKLCLSILYCQKVFALAITNLRFAEKNRLSGNIAPRLTVDHG